MGPALLTPILESYSWTRVFERVEQVYFQALSRTGRLFETLFCL